MRRSARFPTGRVATLFAAAALVLCGLSNAEPQSGGPSFGDGILVERQPRAVEQPRPEYTEAMARLGLSGTVVLQVLVGKDGCVRDTRVFQSVPGLDSAAVAAVRRWTFEPARSNGRPIPLWVAVPISFPPQDSTQGAAGSGSRGHGPAANPGQPDTSAWNARLAAAVDSAWTRFPPSIAVEFAGRAECECVSFTVHADRTPDLPVSRVTVTREGFPDDSVRGDRLELLLRRQDGRWRIERAARTWRCWPNRGHETYGTEPCR